MHIEFHEARREFRLREPDHSPSSAAAWGLLRGVDKSSQDTVGESEGIFAPGGKRCRLTLGPRWATTLDQSRDIYC